MIASLRSEFFRLRKRRAPYLLWLILVLLIAMLYVLLWVTWEVDTNNDAALGDLLSVRETRGQGMELAHSIVIVMSVILASFTVASEYAWGTIRTMLPRSAGRNAFLGAKVVIVAAFAVATMLIGFLAAFSSSVVISMVSDIDGGTGDGFVTGTIVAVARASYAVMPYAAMSIMASLLSRSNAVGIGAVLGLYFLEDLPVLLIGEAGDAGEFIANLFLSSNVLGLMQANALEPVDDAMNPWRAAAGVTVYTVVFLVIAFWRFRTRDVHANS